MELVVSDSARETGTGAGGRAVPTSRAELRAGNEQTDL